jgi:hypothetical protein
VGGLSIKDAGEVECGGRRFTMQLVIMQLLGFDFVATRDIEPATRSGRPSWNLNRGDSDAGMPGPPGPIARFGSFRFSSDAGCPRPMATLMNRRGRMIETSDEVESDQPVVSHAELRHLKLMEYAVARAGGRDGRRLDEWRCPTFDNVRQRRLYADFGLYSGRSRRPEPDDAVWPEHRSRSVEEGPRKVLRDGSAVFDVIHYRKDGTPIWLEIVVIPLTAANGATTATLSFARELKALNPRTYAAPFS